jgi:predicted transcriptional regulator
MSSISDEFASFTQFANVRLQSEPVESLEELVDLWRLEHPTAEEQADVQDAIRQGLADIEAGRYRPVDVVMEELRVKYNLPAQ